MAELEIKPPIERIPGQRISLIVCGQGSVIESGSSVKAGTLDAEIPGIVERYGANTWMRFIARSMGILDKHGEVDVIIPSGRATGGAFHIRDEKGQLKSIEPTEASLMAKIAESVYGSRAEVKLETEARNTLMNVINSANIVDDLMKGAALSEIRDQTYILGTQFHKPRIKLLAILFGFDPSHVLSAEEVFFHDARANEARTLMVGNAEPSGFIKSAAQQELIKTRLEGSNVMYEGESISYYERKKARAQKNLDRLISRILDEKNLEGEARESEGKRLRNSLFIEEGKDVSDRMRGERRWARGLVEVPETYLIPLGGLLKSDERRIYFLSYFDSHRISVKTWDWRAVKESWENEAYPPKVIDRLRQLGLDENSIALLSNAQVSAIQ